MTITKRRSAAKRAPKDVGYKLHTAIMADVT
jgi:hypothetical protein